MEKCIYFLTKWCIRITNIINFFFPIKNIICIDINTLNYHNYTLFYYSLYYSLFFLLTVFYNLPCKINKYLINHKNIYKYQDKFYISDDFLIDFKKLNKNKKSDVNIRIIDSVKLKLNNNSQLEITNKIKQYDDNFPIIIFCKLNNINILDIKEIVINFFILGKIETKSLLAKDVFKKNKIKDLWN